MGERRGNQVGTSANAGSPHLQHTIWKTNTLKRNSWQQCEREQPQLDRQLSLNLWENFYRHNEYSIFIDRKTNKNRKTTS